MKVTFVLPAYFNHPIGGYKVVYEHANYLAEHGNEVTIIYPRDVQPPKARFKAAIGTTIWYIKTKLKNRLLVSWFSVSSHIHLKLTTCIDQSSIPDADAVIATAWQTARPVSLLPAAKGRQYYLVQDHEIWGDSPAEEVNSTFGLGLRVVTISTWLSEVAMENGATSTRLVPNGFDHAAFFLLSEPTARPPSILALFHTEERKNVRMALAAMTYIHEKFPDVALTMFGVSERPASLSKSIKYIHSPSPDELNVLYNDHSIFLSTSTLEGWCLPAAEAMACGCAFVGTDSKGPREFCSNEANALLSSPNDMDALVGNLERVIDDSSLRNRLQIAGEVAMRQFTWDRSGAAFANALAE